MIAQKQRGTTRTLANSILHAAILTFSMMVLVWLPIRLVARLMDVSIPLSIDGAGLFGVFLGCLLEPQVKRAFGRRKGGRKD